MQMNINPSGHRPTDQSVPDNQSRLEPLRTDRSVSSDDSEVSASVDSSDDPVVLGPEKARGATINRMPARVLMISIALTAVTFIIGYLLVR